MSPTPLIELQRRLAEAGRIRMGEKTDKGAPKRLDTWRITSPTRELVEQAAGLYGGKPKEWDSPTGKQWEVVTATAELPVLCMPAYSFRQQYEFRTSPTLVERRCDGVEMEDGSPCKCNAEGLEGKQACDLISRLTVALPELTTMLGWRLETKGENAARELLASMDLVQGVAHGRPFVPAKLRIVERRGNVNGQAVRYVVPVIDVSVSYASILGGELASLPSDARAALPAGYIPIEAQRVFGTSLEEGLLAAETQTLTRPPRVALPDDDVEDDDVGASPSSQASAGAAAGQVDVSPGGAPALKPTQRQIKKLGTLVGRLRDDATAITTVQLWSAVARMRNVDVTVMEELLHGTDDEGVLHFGPLLADLNREEASSLIDRLERLESNLLKVEA